MPQLPLPKFLFLILIFRIQYRSICVNSLILNISLFIGPKMKAKWLKWQYCVSGIEILTIENTRMNEIISLFLCYVQSIDKIKVSKILKYEYVLG